MPSERTAPKTKPRRYPAHLGRRIEARIKELGITKAEFGRRINTSRQNVSSLLKKRTFDTELLWRTCEALDYDFFAFLSEKLGPEPDPPSPEPPVFAFVALDERIPKELAAAMRDLLVKKLIDY